MRPYLSIIIPYHNSEETIGRLIQSIANSKKAPHYEIIIVDDCSSTKFQISNSPSTKLRTSNFLTIQKLIKQKKLFLKIIHLERNRGPAAARNRGARVARGKFLLFLDSDVELFPDTLHNLARHYIEDPDIVAQTGVWVKEQRTSAFFPNFKALRDWSYWINERDKSGYYFLFSTRIASIKKSVFMRLGGFDEMYSGALVEDIELTYRIARRYAIIFSQDVRVRHEFEGFWPIAKKYFLRAYHWTSLYARRKKFDPVATTLQEAMTTISGVGTVATGVAALLSLPTLPLIITSIDRVPTIIWTVASMNFYFFGFSFLIHLFLIRKFMVFLYIEKGLIFALKGFFTGLILYCFIFAGVAWGKLKSE